MFPENAWRSVGVTMNTNIAGRLRANIFSDISTTVRLEKEAFLFNIIFSMQDKSAIDEEEAQQ